MISTIDSLIIPSPLELLSSSLCASKKIKLHIKREDQIHPILNGNKFRKLKYNIEHFGINDYSEIITFGGAFSNHIHAVAAAGRLYSIPTIGIIRGEYDDQNPTLQFAKSCGMQLHFVDRNSFREKEKSPTIQSIINQYPKPYILPEGGTNSLALKGTEEIINELYEQHLDINHVCVSAGTGGTAAGILSGLKSNTTLHIFSSLKGDFLKADINDLSGKDNFELITDYHFGGYGKTSQELISFINQFHQDHNIILDPIYNGKGLYGVMDMVAKNQFEVGSSIVWILTGGQQGNTAWNYMNGGGLIE